MFLQLGTIKRTGGDASGPKEFRREDRRLPVCGRAGSAAQTVAAAAAQKKQDDDAAAVIAAVKEAAIAAASAAAE